MEQFIEIKHNDYKITLEKIEYTDFGWTDITIENTKTGRCTALSKLDSDIFYSILPLIDTDWVDGVEDCEE